MPNPPSIFIAYALDPIGLDPGEYYPTFYRSLVQPAWTVDLEEQVHTPRPIVVIPIDDD